MLTVVEILIDGCQALRPSHQPPLLVRLEGLVQEAPLPPNRDLLGRGANSHLAEISLLTLSAAAFNDTSLHSFAKLSSVGEEFWVLTQQDRVFTDVELVSQ